MVQRFGGRAWLAIVGGAKAFERSLHQCSRTDMAIAANAGEASPCCISVSVRPPGGGPCAATLQFGSHSRYGALKVGTSVLRPGMLVQVSGGGTRMMAIRG